MQFQKIEPHEDNLLNKGIIHHDFIENEVFSGVIYLNDNSVDSGTSFYELKDNHKNYNTKIIRFNEFLLGCLAKIQNFN